jgi:hypothetical protein
MMFSSLEVSNTIFYTCHFFPSFSVYDCNYAEYMRTFLYFGRSCKLVLIFKTIRLKIERATEIDREWQPLHSMWGKVIDDSGI